ncbi:MAG: EamA family transporter [Paracoccaceae bacterium]
MAGVGLGATAAGAVAAVRAAGARRHPHDGRADAVSDRGGRGRGVFVWFRLLGRYKASQVAGFGFLSPVFGVAVGWLWLGEAVTASLLAKLALVATGIVLINRH